MCVIGHMRILFRGLSGRVLKGRGLSGIVLNLTCAIGTCVIGHVRILLRALSGRVLKGRGLSGIILNLTCVIGTWAIAPCVIGTRPTVSAFLPRRLFSFPCYRKTRTSRRRSWPRERLLTLGALCQVRIGISLFLTIVFLMLQRIVRGQVNIQGASDHPYTPFIFAGLGSIKNMFRRKL
jgi:hypothetical protein